MLLRHLPILELHTPTPPPTIDFFENLDDYSMTPGAITSLYFDSPSNDLPLYHDRVALKEGANLLRIRWCVRLFCSVFVSFVGESICVDGATPLAEWRNHGGPLFAGVCVGVGVGQLAL